MCTYNYTVLCDNVIFKESRLTGLDLVDCRKHPPIVLFILKMCVCSKCMCRHSLTKWDNNNATTGSSSSERWRRRDGASKPRPVVGGHCTVFSSFGHSSPSVTHRQLHRRPQSLLLLRPLLHSVDVRRRRVGRGMMTRDNGPRKSLIQSMPREERRERENNPANWVSHVCTFCTRCTAKGALCDGHFSGLGTCIVS